MTYNLVWNKSNMTGATRGAGTAYPFFIPGFYYVVLFILAISMSDFLRYTAYGNPFSIFKFSFKESVNIYIN
jgi:hypothetical protein